MSSNYPAHIRLDSNNQYTVQSVEEHCKNVANIAKDILVPVGYGNIAYLAGILHDIGKFTPDFKNYIWQVTKGEDVKRGSVNHTFATVRYIMSKYNYGRNDSLDYLYEFLSIATGSHHGLLDINKDGINAYDKRINYDNPRYNDILKLTEEYCITKEGYKTLLNKALEETNIFLSKVCTNDEIQEKCKNNSDTALLFFYALFSRLITSAIVSGDRQDTASFMFNQSLEDVKPDWKKLAARIDNYINNLPVKHDIDNARAYISNACKEAADKNSGVYRLDVPTGGGKTYASLRYAVSHAAKYNKRRIFFVMPLLSIIEQNAADIRNVVNDDSLILEHHSDVINETDNDDTADNKKLLTDFWTAPIIITTLVQMLNTFYSHKMSSVCRFSSLVNSIIVFDEVQTVPYKMLSLFNFAISFLATYCNATIILCSATQPYLEDVHYPLLCKTDDLIVLPKKVKEKFKRVEIVNEQSMDMHDIIDFANNIIRQNHSLLIVCNTKKEAADIYSRIDAEVKYYLSSAMCTNHRKAVVGKIKNDLKNNIKVLCVSTQVIEAGVNVSFKRVIRLQAGLDNIIQTAGRCNRHGECDIGYTYIIKLRGEKLKMLKDIEAGKQATDSLLAEARNNDKYKDFTASDTIKRYYTKLYRNYYGISQDYSIPELNKTIVELLANYNPENKYLLDISSKTAGQNFHVIDNNTVQIIVPYNDGIEIIEKFLSNTYLGLHETLDLIKKAKGYTVSCYPYQINKLIENKSVTFLETTGIYLLTNPSYYNEELGLLEEPDNTAIIF